MQSYQCKADLKSYCCVCAWAVRYYSLFKIRFRQGLNWGSRASL